MFSTPGGYNFEAVAKPSFKRLFYYDSKGINVVCSCDNNEYSLFTGLSQGGSQYPLKQYRVEWDYSQSL
jgi:nitrite reductase/ring-hydroxylating ferredoxin subunit